MRKCKKIAGILLSLLITVSSLNLGIVPARANEKTQSVVNVHADWFFDEAHVKSGSIATGDLVFEDQSGKGNDIEMQSYFQGTPGSLTNYGDYIAFKNDSMSREYSLGTGNSILLTPGNDLSTGVDFISVNGAPINTEDFKNGYTLEFVYRVPVTGISAWSSILARQGNSAGSNEPELGTMNVGFSGERSVQFKTADYKDDVNNIMNRDAWTSPVALKQKDAWHHIAITSDGNAVELYVNGMDTARGYYNELEGMFADPADGRFRIGAAYWEGALDKLLEGNLERIRISESVLGKEDWIIPNPVDLVKPETFSGTQDDFSMIDSENNYNMVIIPDTQYVVQGKNSLMKSAVQWLADNKDQAKIKAVMHLGDITESTRGESLTQEWENARSSFYTLAENGLSTSMVLGNHDSKTEFVKNLGPGSDWDNKMEAKNPGAVIHEPTEGLSSYMIVQAGSYRYMIIAIGYGRTSTDSAWFEKTLQDNPNIPTIVTSHDLVTRSFGLSAAGNNIWNVAKAYDQVFMMVGGHYNGYGYSSLTNNAGNKVFNVLVDYQDEYMGGNAWFKFAEFDEANNKIFMNTFSPYVAQKALVDRTYFDRTYLTGNGHDDVLEINFKERFNFANGVTMNKGYKSLTVGDSYQLAASAKIGGSGEAKIVWSSLNEAVATVDKTGMVTAVEKGSAVIKATVDGMEWLSETCQVNIKEKSVGAWMAGEYHTHSGMSPDINNVDYTTVQNLLDAGFEKNGLDYLVMADHLRMVKTDADNQPIGQNIAYYKAMSDYLLPKIEDLQLSGKYQDKILYTGFEMDLLGFDHVSVALLPDEGDDVPIEGVKEFEYYYSKDTKVSEFSAEDIGKWGSRKNSNDRENAYDAIQWMDDNYPNSYMLLNHPSRYSGKGRSDELTIEEIRKMNDLAPDTVFGFEGIPGNQMSDDGARGELPYGYVMGGADVMIAEVGGVWDALLGEGREFWNFANSDFHFKISSSGIYGSGYWPGEYTKNHTFVEGNDIQAVAKSLRSGNSFSVMGDLINELDYSIESSVGKAEMGETITVGEGKDYTLTIRFKSPEENNYEPISSGHKSSVTNKVSVDHVDLISGKVTGKIDPTDPAYDKATNESTQVVKRFTSEDWKVDEDGYCVITYKVDKADADRYYRLRGTNLGTDVAGMTKDGEPLKDEVIIVDHTDTSTSEVGFNEINDRNYSNMWFYSNPIFVDVKHSVSFETDGGKTVDDILAPEGTIIKEAPVTNRDGYTFDGWYTDKDLKKPVKFPYTVTESVTLYAKWVKDSKHSQYVSGYKDGTFKPENDLTRAEAAAMLFNLVEAMGKEIPKLPNESKFNDVSSGAWYLKAVIALTEMDVVSGYTDGTFRPNGEITRAEFTTMAVKLAGVAPSTGKSQFSDVADTHWAKGYINAAKENKYVSGFEDQSFRPENRIKRVQAIAILNGVDGRDTEKCNYDEIKNPFSDIDGHWGYKHILEAAVGHDIP